MSNAYNNTTGRGSRATGRSRFQYDETQFQPNQKMAAIEMVEYEFSPQNERKTLQQIADDCGVSRMTLHNWNTKDRNFIAYKNAIASDFLDTHTAFVYKKLIDGIEKGSMKGIETFMKRIGDLDNRSEVTVHDSSGGGQSFADRKAALLERLESDKAEIKDEIESDGKDGE